MVFRFVPYVGTRSTEEICTHSKNVLKQFKPLPAEIAISVTDCGKEVSTEFGWIASRAQHTK